MAVDSNAEDPPRGLAIALMRVGEFGEAERVLRNAITSLDKAKRWQLHLTLSQLLTSLGDETDDPQLYEEAIKEVNEAILLNPRHPDPYVYAGVVRFKLDDYGKAHKNFRACLRKVNITMKQIGTPGEFVSCFVVMSGFSESVS
jgi:tetratricopeptide (TPR) repeat protein